MPFWLCLPHRSGIQHKVLTFSGSLLPLCRGWVFYIFKVVPLEHTLFFATSYGIEAQLFHFIYRQHATWTKSRFSTTNQDLTTPTLSYISNINFACCLVCLFYHTSMHFVPYVWGGLGLEPWSKLHVKNSYSTLSMEELV